MIDVAVCDDHGIIRSGIRRILEATPDLQLSASVSTGELLISAIEDHSPEIAVIDIRLPDCSGLDLVERVAEISPGTRVVMLSMYDAKGYVEKAKARGAKGYITKECLEEELIAVLRAVLNDEGFVSFRSNDHNAHDAGGKSRADIDVLSSRELEVLRHVASGLTNAEVADELRISQRTVESHRASVQRKLLVKTRAELARVARDTGLVY